MATLAVGVSTAAQWAGAAQLRCSTPRCRMAPIFYEDMRPFGRCVSCKAMYVEHRGHLHRESPPAVGWDA